VCEGFKSELVAPSPKLQDTESIVFKIVELKATVRGKIPAVGSPEKEATGGSDDAVTVIWSDLIIVSSPPGPLTVRLTE
jgi:hypothetical protein